MPRFIVLLYFLVFSFGCTARAQSGLPAGDLFASKKGGFSLRIPPGWARVPQKEVDDYIKVKIEEGAYLSKYTQIEADFQGRRTTYQMTEALFQREGGQRFKPPMIWLALDKNKRAEEVEVKQFVMSVESSGAARVNYDSKRKIIHLIYPPYSAGAGDYRVTENIIILSRYGSASFVLITPLSDYYRNSEHLSFFIKHFKFRRGSEFGPSQAEAGMVDTRGNRWYNNKGLVFICLVIIMAVIFLFLKKKYLYYSFL